MTEIIALITLVILPIYLRQRASVMTRLSVMWNDGLIPLNAPPSAVIYTLQLII